MPALTFFQDKIDKGAKQGIITDSVNHFKVQLREGALCFC